MDFLFSEKGIFLLLGKVDFFVVEKNGFFCLENFLWLRKWVYFPGMKLFTSERLAIF